MRSAGPHRPTSVQNPKCGQSSVRYCTIVEYKSIVLLGRLGSRRHFRFKVGRVPGKIRIFEAIAAVSSIVLRFYYHVLPRCGLLTRRRLDSAVLEQHSQTLDGASIPHALAYTAACFSTLIKSLLEIWFYVTGPL